MKRLSTYLLIFILLIAICFLGVLKVKYNKIVAENIKLREEYDKIVAENMKLTEDIAQLTTQQEELSNNKPQEDSEKKISITKLSNAGGSLTLYSDCHDLYGNTYSEAFAHHYGMPELIIDSKYTRFTATAFIENTQHPNGGQIIVYCDDEIVYEKIMSKTDSPINLDIDITGCKVLKIYAKNDAVNSDILLYEPCVK